MDGRTESFSDLDLLSFLDLESKVLGGFKDQNDGTSKSEPSHLVTRVKGLTTEERGSLGVTCLDVSSSRVGSRPSLVGSKSLEKAKRNLEFEGHKRYRWSWSHLPDRS